MSKTFGFSFKVKDKKETKPSASDAKLQSLYPLPSSLKPSGSTSTSTTFQASALTSTAKIIPKPGLPKKHRTEEEYFDSVDDEPINQQSSLQYQPAPGSPGREDDDDDEDELEAYMANIERAARKELETIGKKTQNKKETKGTRDDIEEEDDQESFFRWLEENPNAGVLNEGANNNNDEIDQDIDYDEEGNIIVPEKSKFIDPLPPIDHSQIEYENFEKNFYEEHEDIKNLNDNEVNELRKTLDIKVTGVESPKPICSFAHFGFDEQLMKAIRKSEFTQPTPIQAQAIPAALSGRDIIGIAKTGSGKTAAFLWPALVHIMDQKELKPGDGPIVLILVPTRELAQQIYTEAKKFSKVYNISCACAFGGGSLYEQTLACQEGCEILVCTPGRLIDLIKKKGTNLQRVTYLVFDEADRMFDMGFEPQVRSIANHVRPGRQTLLFSATFKKKVEKLAREILIDPIRIIQGELGEANENITQIVKVFQDGPEKWKWLTNHLVEFTSAGKVLIFVTTKLNSAELEKNLEEQGYKSHLLHGDMHQDDRTKVINEFKKSDIPILVATDVAARGLDIPTIKTVVNYDVARDIDTHTHRIGRTGRAGEKGTAYTLVTSKDKEFCPHLVRNLESANQNVPEELLNLALQIGWFKNSRFKKGGAKKLTVGGKGLGYRERPGLGAAKGTKPGYSSGDPIIDMKSINATATSQTDRVAAMKEAFSSQFKTHFVGASQETAWKQQNSVAVPSVCVQKREFKEPKMVSDGNNDDSNKTKSKRSRWDA